MCLHGKARRGGARSNGGAAGAEGDGSGRGEGRSRGRHGEDQERTLHLSENLPRKDLTVGLCLGS